MHFAGPEDNWFEKEVLPWLKEKAPDAKLVVERSVDHQRDGARWGAISDLSITKDLATGDALAPE